jgi:hypothetical protein
VTDTLNLEFIWRFGGISQRLAQLLDVQFVPGSRAQESPIGRALEEVLSLNNARDYAARDMQLQRLGFVLQHLELVATARPDLMPWFRHGFLAPDNGAYVGARQELLVAAALIRAGFEFVHNAPGEPDFKIVGSSAAIECTTAHVTNWSERDCTYKIRTALVRKQAKGYAGSDTALAIGTTNIDAVSSSSTAHEHHVEFGRETSFGSLLTSSIFVNHDAGYGRLASHYKRVDSPNAEADLVRTLDEIWPKGDLPVTSYSIPLTG